MPNEALIQQIAQPISPDQPAGVDTRIDRSFNRIKDARNEASRIEKRAREEAGDPTKSPQDLVTRSQSLPHWKTVIDLGTQALAKRTKDLDIASYMIEAMVRTDGFAGLADAFRFTREMIDNCWDGLYPMPDPDDGYEITPSTIIEERIQPISRLSGVDGEGLLIEPLSWIEVTGYGDNGPYTYWQYRQALEYERCTDTEKEIRRNRGTVTPEQFEEAVRQTPDDEYQALLAAVDLARREYDLLIATITARIDAAGLDPTPRVSSSRLQEELEKCQSTLRHITRGRTVEAAPPEQEQAVTTAQDSRTSVVTSTPTIDNEIRTREDAFRVLLKVAEYFERAEPQSLIPAQLKKVIRLGRLSPSEYFAEILEDRDTREQLFKAFGLEMKEE